MMMSVPGQPGAVGGPPRVGVEHGHDDEDAVLFGHAHRGGRLLGHGVQVGRAVRVDDALGVAGGAARVTHGGGGALVELGPFEARLLGGQEALVGERLAEGRGVALPRHDDRLDRLEVVLDGGQQRDQRRVDDDHAVLGVVDHVGQLLGREADVQGVQDGAHGREWRDTPRDGPGCSSRRCPPGRRHGPQALQGLGQLLRPGRHLGEGGRAVAARLDGDHRAVAVHLLPVPEDVADQEGCVLHRALHGPSMSSARALVPGHRPFSGHGVRSSSWFGVAALVLSAVLMAVATGVVSAAPRGPGAGTARPSVPVRRPVAPSRRRCSRCTKRRRPVAPGSPGPFWLPSAPSSRGTAPRACRASIPGPTGRGRRTDAVRAGHLRRL